jgi:hypothetical protein
MGIYINDYEGVVASLDRGETARTNHINCPAGQDNKQRLYLTRPQGSAEVVLAYCHNCQESGVRRDDIEKYRDYRQSSAPAVQPTVFDIPKGMINKPVDWPLEAHKWRIEKGFNSEAVVNLGIQYDPNTHRIYLPQYSVVKQDGTTRGAKLHGYQLRALDGGGAKYLTASQFNESPSTVFYINCASPAKLDLAFLVEDLASGNALSRTLKYLNIPSKVIVNYGTKVTPLVLNRVQNFKQGVVWLDNDGPHIRDQSEKINKVWAMLSGERVNSEMHLSDPKSEDMPTRIECILKWSKHGQH